MSEVATIEYIRHHTDIPVPEVIRHQATDANKLGFKGMMSRVPGRKLRDQWSSTSWLKKELLVRKIVSYHAQLFQKRFKRIGVTCLS